MTQKKTLYQLLLFFPVLLWLFYFRDYYFSASVYFPEDNFRDHFNLFFYTGHFLRFTGEFPTWYFNSHGGIWYEPLANTFLLLMPYRWLGYLLCWLTDLNFNFIYKSTFLLGQAVFFLGVYLVSIRLLKDKIWATLLCTTAFFSSFHMSLFHQEQVLGTVFFVPWIWLTILNHKNTLIQSLLVGSLIGLSLNNHYPHLTLSYWSLTAALLRPRISWKPAILLLLALLISSSPLMFSYGKYYGKMTSPRRLQTEGLSPNQYSEYEKMNLEQLSSFYPPNLVLLADPFNMKSKKLAPLDHGTVFVSAGLLLAVFLSFFIPVPHLWFQGGMAFSLAILSFGIYSPLSYLLWHLAPPFRLFRQWYHFLPLLNLHLLFFTFFLLKNALESRLKRKTLLGVGVCLTVCFLFGGVHPVFTLIPVGLLVFYHFYPSKHATLILGSLWLLGVGVAWSIPTMKEYLSLSERYQEVLEKNRLPRLSETDAFTFFKDIASSTPLPFERALPNAVPKLLPKSFELPLDAKKVFIQPTKGGLLFSGKFEMQSNNRLRLLQFDDSQWKVSHSTESHTVQVTRPRTHWYTLIYLMWVPLLFSLIWTFTQRNLYAEAI